MSDEVKSENEENETFKEESEDLDMPLRPITRITRTLARLLSTRYIMLFLILTIGLFVMINYVISDFLGLIVSMIIAFILTFIIKYRRYY